MTFAGVIKTFDCFLPGGNIRLLLPGGIIKKHSPEVLRLRYIVHSEIEICDSLLVVCWNRLRTGGEQTSRI